MIHSDACTMSNMNWLFCARNGVVNAVKQLAYHFTKEKIIPDAYILSYYTCDISSYQTMPVQHKSSIEN